MIEMMAREKTEYSQKCSDVDDDVFLSPRSAAALNVSRVTIWMRMSLNKWRIRVGDKFGEEFTSSVSKEIGIKITFYHYPYS
jgi:hypothetical protein